MLQHEVVDTVGQNMAAQLAPEVFQLAEQNGFSKLSSQVKPTAAESDSSEQASSKLTLPFESQCFASIRSSGLSMLVVFAENGSLLEPLKHIVLSVEEEIRKYNIQDSQMVSAESIDLFGCIDALDIAFYLGDEKLVQHKANRLKRKLAEWAPSSYLIESALNDFLRSASTEQCSPWYISKLEACKKHYYAQRNRMVQANIRLVYSVANRFRHVGLNFEDLVQEGHLGLIKAVERFDFSKGFRFSTYAHIVISQSIHLAIDKQAGLVRLPFKALREKAPVEKARQQLEQSLGRSPSMRELADHLSDELEYKDTHISNVIEPNASSQQLYSQPDDSELLEERSPFEQDMKTAALKHADLVSRILESLTERESNIVRMRYGIGLSKEFTLEEISQSIGLSRERVRQLSHQAVEKLSRQFA